MPFIRGGFFRTLLLCGLLALCCLPAHAQEAAHSQANQQQAADINIMQQPAYLQAMNDCMIKAVNPPVLQNGQRVDPSIYRITGDKFQIIRKCMGEKGFPAPDVKRYSQTGGANRNVVRPVPPPEAPVIAPPADVPPVAAPPEAQGGASAPPPAPPPPIYNASPAGNDNNGAKPLWVVPQSQ